MFSKSTDHGNDVMVLQFFFLFLRSKIFQEISTEIDIKTVTVDVMVKKKNKPATISHGRVQNNGQQVTGPDDRPNIF